MTLEPVIRRAFVWTVEGAMRFDSGPVGQFHRHLAQLLYGEVVPAPGKDGHATYWRNCHIPKAKP